MRHATATVLLLAASGCGASGGDPADAMVLPHTRADLVDVSAWDVVRARPDAGLAVQTVTPSIDPYLDSADRHSLVLPPDGELRMGLPSGMEDVFLEGFVGVDLALARDLARAGAPPVAVDFEVHVDGELRFRRTVTTHAKLARDQARLAHLRHEWHPLREDRAGGGASTAPALPELLRITAAIDPEVGIALDGASELRLVTRLVGELPAKVALPRAGFGDLRLVERELRPRTRASSERPNLLFITMDTLRADRTSTFGYGRQTTPNLTRLAQRGLAYDAAYSASSWTWPSTASLMTGLAPEEHGVLDHRSCFLVDELETLAEVLQGEGVTTAAFSGNPLVSPWRGFDQGFETFGHVAEFSMSERIVPDALDWLAQNGDRRFFLYLHLVDPHSPHLPRDEDLRAFCGTTEAPYQPKLIEGYSNVLRASKQHTADGWPDPRGLISDAEIDWLRRVYDASVATGDYWLGLVLDTLERFGLAETTVVVFTSDHGEEFLDHGLVEHAHGLWEELVHVPLVAAGPGLPAGERRTVPVSNRHLAPTLARMMGASMDAPSDALDLLAPSPPEPRPVFTDTRKGWWNGREFQPLHGVRHRQWTLHWAPRGSGWGEPEPAPGEPGDMRLYDLDEDPGQRTNLVEGEGARARDLRAAIAAALARQARGRPTRRVEAGAATLELLESVGYGGGGEEEGR